MTGQVNRKSLPERTADAIMLMLNQENYGVGLCVRKAGGGS